MKPGNRLLFSRNRPAEEKTAAFIRATGRIDSDRLRNTGLSYIQSRYSGKTV